jgi:uncharacterized repeat protein (TIGR01451 family)
VLIFATESDDTFNEYRFLIKMSKTLFTLLTGLLFLGSVSVASATGTYGTQNCQPIYGGGQTCVSTERIVLNKTVRNPQTGSYVDNLSLNDPRYFGGQSVSFQLTITNSGDTKLSEVTVSDTLPNYIEKVSGPGSFDSKTKVLTFKLTNLEAGESRTFTLTGTLVDSSKLPLNQGITCLVNQAVASANSQESRDNSQFCVEKQAVATKGGLPVLEAPPMKETPPTGPEMLSLVGLIPAAGFGFWLRRRTNKV